MNRQTMTKVFSTILSVALLAASVPVPAVAIGPAGPAFVPVLTPPTNMGYVASSFAPNNEEKPRLIVISDLHGHLEVQRHIMGILDNLMKHLRPAGATGKPLPIFVEGGWESGLEEPLRLIKDPAVRSFMAEYYLQKAEINASQAYSEKVAGTGQVTLIGAENKDEYLANKARFVKTYPERKALLLAIQREEAALRIIEDQVSGRAFKRLQEARADYLNGRIAPESYASKLLHAARRIHLTGHAVNVLQNASTADSTDLEIAFSEVYRSVIASAAEQKPLTALLREPVQNEDTVRQNLARIDASLDLLKRLIGNQLTPEEVPLALARMPELVSVADMLLEKTPMAGQADKVVRESFDFYPFAMVRDDSLTDNSIAALDRMGTDATGILVAGGFHTDAIVNRLREKGISYMLIHPSISRDLSATEQLNYVKRVCDDHVTVPEILRDIDSLRHGGGNRLSESAIGAVSDMESPKTDSEKSMLGGIADIGAAQAHLAADAVALQRLLANANLSVEDIGLSPKALEPAANQLKSRMGAKAYEEIKDQIQWNEGVVLDQKLNGDYSVSEGAISKDNAKVLAQTVNAVLHSVEGGKATADHISNLYFVSIPDKVATEKLGVYGRIYGRSEDATRTVLLGVTQFNLIKQTLDQLGKAPAGSDKAAALSVALHSFVHELVHPFDAKGASETQSTLKSIVFTAGLVAIHAGGEKEARDAVAGFAAAIGPILANSKEVGLRWIGTALPDLATTIADLFVTQGFSAESVQEAVNLLAAKHPEQSLFEIQKTIDEEVKEGSLRNSFDLSAGDDKVPPSVVKKADEKLDEAGKKAGGFLRSV